MNVLFLPTTSTIQNNKLAIKMLN